MPNKNNMELGPMIPKDTGAKDEDIKKDFLERTQDNLGAANVLGQLAARGTEIYNTVAPNLGFGSEIWEKFNNECGKDLDTLIEKYGK